MKFIDIEEKHVKMVSCEVVHNDKGYIISYYYCGRDMIDTILKDKDDNIIVDPELCEEIGTFLDNEGVF
jgi:hypothetical protein